MTWAGQSVFALPCGNVGSMYGATTPGDATESTVYIPISGLQLNLAIGFRRAAAIWVLGSVTNDTGGQLSTFSAQVDGVVVDEACDVLFPTDDARARVSFGCQVILEPGARVIEAVWKTAGSGNLEVAANQLHLEVILGQAVP